MFNNGKINELSNIIERQQSEITELRKQNEILTQSELDTFKDIRLMESSGIYESKHVLNTKTEFKDALKHNRAEQRKYNTYKNCIHCIKGTEVIANLAIRSFNLQCKEIIDKLDGYNITSVQEQIVLIANELIDVCNTVGIKVFTDRMITLKLEQAELENDYKIFQAEEKYKKREQAKKIREQEKANKEWLDRLNVLKEKEEHYDMVLEIDPNDESALKEKETLTQQIEQTRHMLREQKSGFIYVISNDDMGKGMVKLGLTRRPNPLLRISELSNASHAFKFKVHAFIYSKDCFALETALHRRFADKRVNPDNYHKEFFYVTPEEVQTVLKDEFDIDCAMVDNLLEDDAELEKYYNFTFEEEE